MCQGNECLVYEAMFAMAIRRRRASVVTLLALMVVTGLVGVALLLTTFFLNPVAGIATLEIFKGGFGLVVSASSVVVAKDVLDRWIALAPLEIVRSALQDCSVLSQADLEAHWAIAKELAKKL
jgi:hypothetical protein